MKTGTFADAIHCRVVRRACDLVGPAKLAERVGVSHLIIEEWLAGISTPPPRPFFKMVDILKEADPTYRPLTSE